MADRPIIFSGPMVRALLEGRKTQTRRVLLAKSGIMAARSVSMRGDHWLAHEYDRSWPLRLPYAPGDRLYVREAHARVPASAYRMSDGVAQTIDPNDKDMACIYREDWERSTGGLRWRPSIHMPRWASRLTLTVTEVRVQRLQEISETDAVAEGGDPVQAWMYPELGTCRHWFADLWNSLHGPGAWAANPWVAAYTFRPVLGNIDRIAS